MSDRALELNDIQGNVVVGFNTDVQILVGLTVTEASRFPAAATWLASLAPSVTVVSEVRARRAMMKEAATQSTWLCVAVGQRLLKATQPDVLIRDDAFLVGMLRRAPSVLADKTDPSNWRVGGSRAPLDVMLVIGGNHEDSVRLRADSLTADAAVAGLTATYRDTGRRLDGEQEHFGFRDGISQPRVTGLDPDGTLGPGHFVFGYPKAAGEEPYSPVVDPRGVTDNGSLLVFRRLTQNVAAFRTFCADEASRLAPSWPGLSPQHLAALLVGRWPSGAPIKAGQTEDPGGSPPDNGFDFLNDPNATSCPFGAHIRKVNPRNGPKDVLEVPRMLRRGIPFGLAFDSAPEENDRGLAFLAFQTSVKSQFEFLTQHWMNSALNPARGNDLLVGRSDGTLTMQIAGPDGPIEVSSPGTPWIVPTGGAYLFAPSRSGLAKFGTPPAPIGLWKVKQLLAITSDSIKASLFD